MSIAVDCPKVTVTLLKLVGRKDAISQRYAAAPRNIDLTAYLGDGAEVKVEQAIGSDAGTFSISFGDRMEPTVLDSLYSIVEAMDMVEIRAAREAYRYVGAAALPLIMRGLVTGVEREENFAAGQKHDETSRKVTIVGHDFGKILRVHRIHHTASDAMGTPFLAAFDLGAHSGMQAQTYPVSDFITLLIKEVVNPWIEGLSAFADRAISPFTVQASVSEGTVTPFQLKAEDQTVWQILEQVRDVPWNELFIDEGEQGPVLVFRRSPYRDLSGALVMAGATDPGAVTVGDEEAICIKMRRGDENVANVFWVPPGDTMLSTGYKTSVATVDKMKATDTDYGNNLPVLYGVQKKMERRSRLLPTEATYPRLTKPEQRLTSTELARVWLNQRALDLKAMNRDNSVLESGQVTLIGREQYKIGKYLCIVRGAVVVEGYMSKVSHTFSPLGPWTTTVDLTRCTGFVNRLRLSGSPYLSEGMKGPYSP